MGLNFKQYGQGEPLIILHGLLGSLDNWQTLAREFAKEYSVFTIDLRNHGRSFHNDIMDYPSLANDIAEFMNEHWIYNANVLGHSMGGKTAMQLALDFPELVQKLIVVDIAPKVYVGGHQPLFDAMLNLDVNHLQSRSEADLQLKSSIPNDNIRLFLLKNLSRNKLGGYRWKSNLNAIVNNYSKILENIDGDIPSDIPTLFIKGGNSDYIDDDEEIIKAYFSNAKIEIIEGAGHWVHAEKPKKLAQIVLDFLKE